MEILRKDYEYLEIKKYKILREYSEILWNAW